MAVHLLRYLYTRSLVLFFGALLDFWLVCLGIGSVLPETNFTADVLNGHVYVKWKVDPDFIRSRLPIFYNISYCLPEVNACQNVTTVCETMYIYSGNVGKVAIHSYEKNLLKFLTNDSFDDATGTIESPGPLVSVAWDESRKTFTCGMFLHRCMSPEVNPRLKYTVKYNGTNISPQWSTYLIFGVGTPVKANNITVQQQSTNSCGLYNVTLSWQIPRVCGLDVPDFSIWLDHENVSVRKMVKLETAMNRKYSFIHVFPHLRARKNYVAYIESRKSLGFITSSVDFTFDVIERTPVKANNITVRQQGTNSCGRYNVTLTWQILRVCRLDVPDFSIWLDHENVSVREMVKLDTAMNRNYSFMHVFPNLSARKNYVAYIESCKSLGDVTSRVSFTFDVIEDIVTNISVTDGYFYIGWQANERLLALKTPVMYDISFCPKETAQPPYGCWNNTKILCRATFNASANGTGGLVFKENWQGHVKNRSGPSKPSPLLMSWNDTQKRFKCGISFDSPLSEELFQYDVYYGAHHSCKYERISVGDGYAIEPDSIRVESHPSSSNPNDMAAKFRWRLRRVWATCVSPTIVVYLTKPGGKGDVRFDKKTYLSYKLGEEVQIFYVDDLLPYTLYAFNIETQDRGRVCETTTKVFRTPEGVPDSRPSIIPTATGTSVCIDNRRNVTISWKLPDPEDRNGVIRNVNLMYFRKDNSQDKREVYLGNVTSAVLTGLNCDVSYVVQVRACIHANRSCSEYSEPHEIKSKAGISSARKTDDLYVIWISLGIGVAIVAAALIICQLKCHRKPPKLEQLSDAGLDHSYEPGNSTEMAETGIYHPLHEDLADEFSRDRLATSSEWMTWPEENNDILVR